MEALLKSRGPNELILGVAGDAKPGSGWQPTSASRTTIAESHQPLLADGGGMLRHGITPFATEAKHSLKLDKNLVICTGVVHAPLPPLLRPASPSKEIRDRAGFPCRRLTLNGARALSKERERLYILPFCCHFKICKLASRCAVLLHSARRWPKGSACACYMVLPRQQECVLTLPSRGRGHLQCELLNRTLYLSADVSGRVYRN